MTRQELIQKLKREQAEKLQELADASELYDKEYEKLTKEALLEFCRRYKVSAIELYFFRQKQGAKDCVIGSFERQVETKESRIKRWEKAREERKKRARSKQTLQEKVEKELLRRQIWTNNKQQ